VAQSAWHVESLARDGFGRRASSALAGQTVHSPGVLQVLGGGAGPVGHPPLTLETAGAVPAGEGAVRFLLGRSPLFEPGVPEPTGGVVLPRIVPKSYGVGPLTDPAELVRVEGPVASALPSRAGSAHMARLPPETELLSLQNLTELRGRPREFVRAVCGARSAAGPRPLLLAHAVADPASAALLIYMGADLLDDFEALLAASAGIFLYSFGHVAGGLPGACMCHACEHYFEGAGLAPGPAADAAAGRAGDEADSDFGEGRGAASRRDTPAVDPGSPLFAAALGHNRRAIAAEVAAAARAVQEGTLRELVEGRVRAYPWLVAALRNVDREFYREQEALTPIWKARLHALSHESLSRPEVRRWGERLKERYAPPPSARAMLLVPCSARKPYSLSKTQHTIDRALADVRPRFAVHRVVVTSPLGLVPMELERVFPAAHYDIPVTGDWAHEEERRVEEQLLALLSRHAYAAVVSLVGDDLPGLSARVGAVVECSAKGKPNEAGLAEASDALQAALTGAKDVPPRQRLLEDLASIARMQFGGPPGAALFEGAALKGRWPWSKVFAGATQLAMHVPERGRLSLTLDGAKRVADAGGHRVTVGDFRLRGDIFAVGVEGADPEIRAGDEVAVVQRGEVVAAGVARMSALEMVAARRGVAVAVRHRDREAK
jgi:archaeosine synthase